MWCGSYACQRHADMRFKSGDLNQRLRGGPCASGVNTCENGDRNQRRSSLIGRPWAGGVIASDAAMNTCYYWFKTDDNAVIIRNP